LKRFCKKITLTNGELGSVCTGDDKLTKIEEYGTKAPFGKVPLVPSLHLPMVSSGAQITGILNKIMFDME